MNFLKKLEVELLHIQQLYSWVYDQRKQKHFKKTHAPNIHSVIIYNSQDMEAT